jgi:parallel beta-helix repeat protein
MKGKAMGRTLCTMTIAAILVGSQGVAAAITVAVGTCRPQLVSFPTIQAAVNQSPPSTVIDICPGTYPEQVSINKNLTLTGVTAGTADAAVIGAPPGGIVQNATDLADGSGIAAQIFVQGAAVVNVNHLIVDGSNNQIAGCGPDLVGIYYQNSSGTIGSVVARNQALSTALNGCQSGLGIFVESGYGSGGSANVTIKNSSVHSYQKNGITADGSATLATISNNYVVGQGPTTGAAENGIQVSDGATGTISGNEVVDDIYSPASVGASGILIFDSGSLTISSNTVSDTQFGIVVYSDGALPADNNKITGNHVSATHLDDGIDLCSNGNTAQNNIVFSSDGAGIHIDSTCTESGGPTGNNTTVTGNSISEACAGVLLGNGSGNTSTPNTLFNVPVTTKAGDTCAAQALRRRIMIQPQR